MVSRDELERHSYRHRSMRGRPPVLSDALLARIAAMREQGMSLSAIGAQLEREGVPTAHGGVRWCRLRCRRRSGAPGPSKTTASLPVHRPLLALTAAAAVALGGCAGGSTTPDRVLVPQVVGQRPGRAAASICASGLIPEFARMGRFQFFWSGRGPVPHDQAKLRQGVGPPTIVESDPKVGTSVPAGTRVVLRLALFKGERLPSPFGCAPFALVLNRGS